MSQQENSYKDISAVLLCAGKGTRFGEITSNRPKPLLKIDPLNQVLLEHTIHQLEHFNFMKIGIVTGYLSKQIETYLFNLMEVDKKLREKISIIDSKGKYKKGPLYSFLSITQNRDFYFPSQLYLIIPGDTYFETAILQNIFRELQKNKKIAVNSPLIFYRAIQGKELLEKFEHKEGGKRKSISYVDLNYDDLRKTLVEIRVSRAKNLEENQAIEQILPIVSLPYNFIQKIKKISEKTSLNTLREILNYFSSKGMNIPAINISSKDYFFDIDKKSDLENLNHYIKMRSGQ